MDRILANLNPLTEYAMAFISVVGLYFQVTWTRRGTALGPTLLTTLGIFFCFLGIALGLMDFNANDVKSSVPNLLQGIRTSFWVSVSGIGWALTIKIRLALFGEPHYSDSEPTESATIDDIVTHLVRLNAAVAGNASTSLVNQWQLARTDSNDGFNRLTHALETHAERTAETNSRALTHALSEVVRNFNTGLTDQFGDNFKELNAAVARLVAWQTQYERQLNALIEFETTTSIAMATAAEQFARLADDSSAFAGTADALRDILRALNVERENLTSGMAILGRLIESASSGLPTIESNIVEMTNQISRGVQANQDMLGSVLKNSWQSIQAQNQHLTAMLTKMARA